MAGGGASDRGGTVQYRVQFGKGDEARTGGFRTGAVDRGAVRVVISATGTLRATTTVDVGSQVFDTGLVQYIAANLVSPAHIGLAVFQLLLLGHALSHFVLIQT